MAKGKCKCKSAECEECPEWIFTFADLVMLMMGFFVILWVLKPPAGKNGEAQQALDVETVAKFRDAFGYVPDPNSNDPIDIAALKLKGFHLKKPRGDTTGGETTQEKDGNKGTDPAVTIIRPGKQVGTGGKVLFAPGDAALTPDSIRALDELAKTIDGYRNIFMIKGHASPDDYPEGDADDSAKMALSIRRAQAAADYLVSKGVKRDTLRVQGCAAYEPVVQRVYTDDARALNRRVEVEATDKLVKELQDASKAKPPPTTTPAPVAPKAAAPH
jgi:chemotaxis protein MotB